MIRFRADVLGVEVMNRAFSRLDDQVSDFRSVWPSVAGEFYAIEGEQFDAEGRGKSGKWAALSTAYAKYKAQAFPGLPILRATESLYESMTGPDALDSVYRIDERELVVGTKREGARAHQTGTRRMPARPIIDLTESDKRRMQKAIQKELVRFTRSLGFEVREAA